MEWLSRRTIGIILILEIILVGIFGYSNSVESERNSIILFGTTVIFIAYLVSFHVRSDLLEFFIGERDRKKEKTLIKVIGMGIFLLGLAILGLAFAF